tara:strand:- start:534 stop:827 length:294 start_codon:yes stop_codon:yes gene_type:complete
MWVIDKYIRSTGFKTLKEISKDTGIQLTRVFRILHGKEMKLKEFEIFQKKSLFNLDKTLKIVSLANECAFKLDEEKILEITNFMKRTIKISELKKIN